MINDGSRHGFAGEPYVTSPQAMMIYCARGTTNASGAITFPLTKFVAIYNVQVQAVRDTANPSLAAFAVVRSYSTSQVVVQCFESKGTPVLLLNTTVEGLELATSAMEVHLTVYGN